MKRKDYRMKIQSATTPNVVIKSSKVRFWVTGVLFGIAFVVQLATMFIGAFPESVANSDIPLRAIGFVNDVTAFTALTFGLVVSLPNVPYQRVNNG